MLVHVLEVQPGLFDGAQISGEWEHGYFIAHIYHSPSADSAVQNEIHELTLFRFPNWDEEGTVFQPERKLDPRAVNAVALMKLRDTLAGYHFDQLDQV